MKAQSLKILKNESNLLDKCVDCVLYYTQKLVSEITSPAWRPPPRLEAPGGGAPRAARLYHSS